MCLPYLKFSDPLPETHLFFYLALVDKIFQINTRFIKRPEFQEKSFNHTCWLDDFSWNSGLLIYILYSLNSGKPCLLVLSPTTDWIELKQISWEHSAAGLLITVFCV